MAELVLDKVNKIYGTGTGRVHAVEDLSLKIDDGEFVALLGPSGCGKTSTLRMIVGLEPISGGTIRFDDVVVNDLKPEQRNVAMAFETYALYPNFTVAENLGFPLEVRKVPPAERRREVERIAGMLQIDHILKQKPGQLSGGQQQRVSLGRALIRDPAVFILDEVLSHLDAHLKFQMLFELKRIHQSLGKTMVYVTHDQVEALALADRVAVMADARLQQFGSRDDLYDAPANRFVADFIGEPPTNFFEVEIVETDGTLGLEVQTSALRFFTDQKRTARLRQTGLRRATVGIRPQNLFLDPFDGSGSIDVRVVINEFLGERSILEVARDDVAFHALAGPDVRLSNGDGVTLHYRPRDVMVFDPNTEELIA